MDKIDSEMPKPLPSDEKGFEGVQIHHNAPFRALIIDDEEMVLDLLQDLLLTMGNFEIELASEVDEALEKFKTFLPQIVILDIRLSGQMSGVEILKKIKAMDTVANVIMITAYGSIDLAIECMKMGAWDFVTKPFSHGHFEVVIKHATENLILKKKAQERDYFFELSRMDSLTEVFNRRLFELILDSEIARCQRHSKTFSLMLIDLDNFKEINDIFGHRKGDEVLKNFALIMKKSSRESDMIFRYGGDEFAIILPETEQEGTQIFSKRLQQQVQDISFQGTDHNGEVHTFTFTVSIGAVTFPYSANEKTLLIQKADDALLEAKRTTKNKIVYY